MARKSSLRDFQAYLAGRLSDAAQGGRAASWLGIEARGESWLVELSDGGEIVQAPQLTEVPLTRPWFAGIANVRGNLHSVTDFSAFLGGPQTPRNANTRLLLIGTRHGSNAALLVSRMLGLKNPEDFVPADADEQLPAWGRQRFSDVHGGMWHKLSVRELLADPEFMNIGT
ncbi:MAG: chemotaxis protein CheW [Azonexaceae bacterium]|uniref:chemotaxis protein CheW n=1 Tax=Azonexus sp. R2A61 TaxID=2744443 RepID=UPI001F44F184|nr:chemotaxis protein CheW [Azonexus sp. R2A61]MCE1240040.1 chemotaxis protein CheW [Azonexaceae bacterium]